MKNVKHALLFHAHSEEHEEEQGTSIVKIKNSPSLSAPGTCVPLWTGHTGHIS